MFHQELYAVQSYKSKLASRVSKLHNEEQLKEKHIANLQKKAENRHKEHLLKEQLRLENIKLQQRRRVQRQRQKQLNRELKLGCHDNISMNAETIQSTKRDLHSAIKDITEEGHSQIQNKLLLQDKVNEAKIKKIKLLKRNWSQNISDFWRRRLEGLKQRREDEDRRDREEMRRCRQEIKRLQSQEKRLCSSLNSKVATIGRLNHFLG